MVHLGRFKPYSPILHTYLWYTLAGSNHTPLDYMSMAHLARFKPYSPILHTYLWYTLAGSNPTPLDYMYMVHLARFKPYSPILHTYLWCTLERSNHTLLYYIHIYGTPWLVHLGWFKPYFSLPHTCVDTSGLFQSLLPNTPTHVCYIMACSCLLPCTTYIYVVHNGMFKAYSPVLHA